MPRDPWFLRFIFWLCQKIESKQTARYALFSGGPGCPGCGAKTVEEAADICPQSDWDNDTVECRHIINHFKHQR